MSEQNKALVRRFLDETWNKKNHSKLEEFLSPQCSFETSDGTMRGLNEYRQHHEALMKAFPDCKLTIDEIVAENDTVTVRYTISGTHKGDLRGLAPTGKQVREPALAMIHLANGKIMNEVSIWDRLSVLEQIGATPEASKMARKAGGR